MLVLFGFVNYESKDRNKNRIPSMFIPILTIF
nr:hypothetical protein FICFSXYB_FICFSXYB_CDS_0006 [Microvirus sp.]